MIERIKRLMEEKQMNQVTFANETGINSASLSSIFSGRTSPTLNMVMAIKERFPEVDTDWLIYGKENDKATPSADASAPTAPQQPQEQSLFTSATMAEPKTQVVTPAPVQPQHQEPKEEKVLAPVREVVREVAKEKTKEVIKEKPSRQIVEVMVFYNDGTYERIR